MNPKERALIASRHEEPDKVPLVLYGYALVQKDFIGVREFDFYQNLRYQVEAKAAFVRRFKDAQCCWSSACVMPEGGFETGTVATAFGGRITWMADAPPWVSLTPINDPEDADKIYSKPLPDPRKSGESMWFLKGIKYFKDWFPLELRREYDLIYGNVGPQTLLAEGLALAMGYDKWMTWMFLHPKELKKLMDVVTDYIIEVVNCASEIVGEAKYIFLPDHGPSFVNEYQFREFLLPYLNRFFKKFDYIPKEGGVRIWHNEGRVSHMLKAIDEIDAEVWQFGAFDDPELCKKNTHFCLMGNLHPPGILLKGDPKEVYYETINIIKKAGYGGGLWISSGGGMAPNTPFDNLEAIMKAIEDYGKYPLSFREESSKE